jgi:hypothetical protein
MIRYVKEVMRLFRRWMPFLGLLVVLSYWYSVRPFSSSPLYSEDGCATDFARQLMSEQIHQFGRPAFVTDQVMTPQGASIPYLSWSLERDWLGSKFWDLNPEFPFAFVFTGISWIVSYLALGWILSRMGKTLRMGPATAWALAAVLTVFHIPRHFKIWHHWEHLNQHWVTLSFFLDAWIWMRLQRERVWDWQLEIWRGFVGLGMIQAPGIYWGPLLLEWMVVHSAILILIAIRKRRGVVTSVPSVRGAARAVALPLVLSAVLLALDARWYPALFEEVRKFRAVTQDLGWFARIQFFFRPLWLEPILRLFGFLGMTPIDQPETVVSVGWFYWVPAVLSFSWIRRSRGGAGVGVALPFIVILFVAVLYASLADPPYLVQRGVQLFVPIMSYFRVASRWGLLLPQILAVIVILSWPELVAGWRRALGSRWRTSWATATFCFVVLSGVEMSWLATPVMQSPPMSPELKALLDGIRQAPGSAVLDLPFCATGGNGQCSPEQCPQYPPSLLSQCLRVRHGKKVYGLFQPRMTEAHCEIYHREPYMGWFSAWRENRCFHAGEWKAFCSYLQEHSEISAVVLYPEIWTAASSPACLAEFDRHLGRPMAEASAMALASRGGEGRWPTRVLWFSGRCL